MRKRLNPATLIIALVALLMLALMLSRLGIITLPPRYDPLVAPDLREKPYWLTDTKLKLLDIDGASCSGALSKAGLEAVLLPPSNPTKACHLEDTVIMSRLSTARLHPEQTRCNIEARLYMWERHVVQPAARRYFGKPVTNITHFGSYNCRNIAGSSHLSQHATANAFDISGLVLSGGKAITVKRNWNGNSQEARFLHEIHSGLCQYFNMVLSPDYNSDHEDHFHVDMGFWRGCH
ncbi:extensin-like domain-containing protein [Aestuariivirga litoralis]|uniref:extensin-like domain-containing protein n=1 Tax=Aestuariivirga litoralis TaxID=2650924 RepID=UPI0018C4AD01|nr:extensin family protein [Aestuariivirga litoralis]MBG1230806.1 extensin family protein [Aestuariivirga litoralis]